jgi:gamma-glutamyl hercynylcysteine S-oxide synthase
MADLADGDLLGPRLDIVNPPLWEAGHIAWFQENWVLRHHLGHAPILGGADALFDSSAVPHAARWNLPLPSRSETVQLLEQVRDRVLENIERLASGRGRYFALLATFHEDMHAEAMLYTRQTLMQPPPAGSINHCDESGALSGDVAVPGGTFSLGSERSEPFVFDNEKWAHPLRVEPFRIARAPVTQAEFAELVNAGGYRDPRLWSDAGWRWRTENSAEQPVYWRRAAGGFERRAFDRWVALEPHRPASHVNAFEAEAYCRFAGRRLPTELEWEAAALGEMGADGSLAPRKRRHPWGDAPIDSSRANLDARAGDCLDVAALPAGDSAFGCRQMLGNLWEWTSSEFSPYPGFSPDPYRDYSLPWFGTHRVLRGGAWPTTSRMIRAAYRNFYTPDRRDVWAGFRTCAI